jgi:hypothetical protein
MQKHPQPQPQPPFAEVAEIIVAEFVEKVDENLEAILEVNSFVVLVVPIALIVLALQSLVAAYLLVSFLLQISKRYYSYY